MQIEDLHSKLYTGIASNIVGLFCLKGGILCYYQFMMLGQISVNADLLEDREILVTVLNNLNLGIYALSNQLNAALQVRKHVEGVLGIEDKQKGEENETM